MLSVAAVCCSKEMSALMSARSPVPPAKVMVIVFVPPAVQAAVPMLKATVADVTDGRAASLLKISLTPVDALCKS